MTIAAALNRFAAYGAPPNIDRVVRVNQKRLTAAYNIHARTGAAYDNGYALASHGQVNGHGVYCRSMVGELVYRAKYHFDRDAADTIANLMVERIQQRLHAIGRSANLFAAIIPVPPSNMDRPFQLVPYIADVVAHRLGVVYDDSCLSKATHGNTVKNMKGYAEKFQVLEAAIAAVDRRYAGKRVLVIDDIIDSGATLDAVAGALKRSGARIVDVMVATATINKK